MKMDGCIKIGMAGLGKRGRSWIRKLGEIPGYQVVAVYDNVEPLHELASRECDLPNDVKRFSDWQEFLSFAGMDAVANCMRCESQGRMSAEAIDAGKHVMAEVPAAHSMEDCWKIVTAVERTGLTYFLVEQIRYAGYVQAWKDLVKNGRLGKVLYCEGHYLGGCGEERLWRDENGMYAQCPRDGSDLTPSWIQQMPPIHYLPHELSPILKILEDRVVDVVGMSTGAGYSYAGSTAPDFQIALMKTEKDTILRMAAGFSLAESSAYRAWPHHWQSILGTHGRLETGRGINDKARAWFHDMQMHDMAEIDWRYERTDEPLEAQGTGHSNTDYYPNAAFRDHLLDGKDLEMDVYGAMDTAAPAILAAKSMEINSSLLRVPDFRPDKERCVGDMPLSLFGG